MESAGDEQERAETRVSLGQGQGLSGWRRRRSGWRRRSECRRKNVRLNAYLLKLRRKNARLVANQDKLREEIEDLSKLRRSSGQAQKKAGRSRLQDLVNAGSTKQGGHVPRSSRSQARPPKHCKGRWGYFRQGATRWQPNTWSRPIPVGFAGNAKRSEQYMVPPPGCPADCKSREIPQGASQALQAARCAGTTRVGSSVTVSAGVDHSCALTQLGVPVCWGDNSFKRATPPAGVKLKSVSAGGSHTCGIRKDTEEAVCWGSNHAKKATPPAGFKLKSVSAGGQHTCGIRKDTEEAVCWGSNYFKQATPPAGVKLESVSAGSSHTCGIRKDTEEAVCWGYNRWKQATPPAGVKLKSVSASAYHTCGIRKDTEEAVCWGSNHAKKATPPAGVKLKSVSAGGDHTCGIRKDTEEAVCWGDNHYKQATPPAGVKLKSVSAGGSHTCGVTTKDEIKCWGNDKSNQCDVPASGVKWTVEPSCLLSHPSVLGAASCTACDPDGCNRHFTIVDPKTNTGTCTATECPFCKPKACCSPGHKHYVLNTASLDGVCVRHNDDCTPICVPRGSLDPAQKRVCTKGCNRLLKVLKNKSAKTEANMFDLVVCQADKRVTCSPRAAANTAACTTEASFLTQVVCKFSPQLWNLGASCIKSLVHKDKHLQCDDKVDQRLIKSMQTPSVSAVCRKATSDDAQLCTTLSLVY